jgi:hypothetical protein
VLHLFYFWFTVLIYFRCCSALPNYSEIKIIYITDKLKFDLPDVILDEVNKNELDCFLIPHELGKMSDRCVNNFSEAKGAVFGFTGTTGNYSKHQFMQRKSKARCFSC